MLKSAEETAKYFIEINFPIEKYQNIQEQRKKRLVLWKQHNIKALIKSEQELIDFGENVLKCMKKAYFNY